MEQPPFQNVDYAAIIKRRVHWLIWPSLLVFFGTCVIAILLPNIYKSEANILIESQQVRSDLVPSTVTTLADQRIEAIKQEVLSRSKLFDLVKKYDLYPEDRDTITADALMKKMTKSIAVKPLSAAITTGRSDRPSQMTIAFTVSFEGEEPAKVQAVVNDLASFFLAKNLKAMQESAEGTSDFLEKQVQKARDVVAELDEQVAVFKKAHLEELPEFMQLNIQKIDKLDEKVAHIDSQIIALQEQAMTAKYKLSFVNPYSAGGRTLTDEEKLQQLQLNRMELKAKYSDDHPLVKSLQNEIDMLQASVAQYDDVPQKRARLAELERNLTQSLAKYTEQHPVVRRLTMEKEQLEKEIQTQGTEQVTKVNPSKITNPAYIELQSELDRINLRMASLEDEKRKLKSEEGEVYVKLRTMPGIEKQYQDLIIDRDNAKRNLNELQKKLQVAEVAQGMEEGQLGENFTIAEPAYLPEEPYKPNRPAWMMLGLILGIGAGFGMAAMKEYSDHSIRAPEHLQKLTGVPTLATIPTIVTPRYRRKKVLRSFSIALAGVFLLAGGLVFFHFAVMDFYVFQAKVTRLLGERLFIYF
jgi:succinoglycan biosynthesis transport protein ExoP